MTDTDRRLVDRFLDMLAAESGASSNTLAAYRSDLAAAATGLPSLAAASSENVADLGGKWGELAPSTVARRAAALRRFFGFLVDEGERSDDPSSALPKPTLQRPLPRILDEEQVASIFEVAEDLSLIHI